jgi:uncharacterized protein YjbI with pentapeptide repeats
MDELGLAALKECLAEGEQGRERWNYQRENDGEALLESFGSALVVGLPNGIKVYLRSTNLWLADLRGRDLSRYNLSGAYLGGAQLQDAVLRDCDLTGAYLVAANLRGADLRGADLSRANLFDADLGNAKLTATRLIGAQLLGTRIDGATFSGSNIHGVSVWGTTGEPADQRDLRITTALEPEITVDDIEVGQFVYLMLHNEKIRNVLQTISAKVVLILGRFTPERKLVLDRLRDELRRLNLSPVLFDFEPASNVDVTDTVTLLAKMARFVIADLTDPSSVQQELSLIAPQTVVAIRPIIMAGHRPWAMFDDLRRRSRGILPVHEYRNVEELVRDIQSHVVAPAEAKRTELLAL